MSIKNLGSDIISKLPYLDSFLFVDEISYVDENKIIGHYTFSKKEGFYSAHFKHLPVTPGVILIEMMGQIGLVCHLIYIQNLVYSEQIFHPILSNVEASFLKPVVVDDRLTIISNKIYFRNKILKSKIELYNSNNELCTMLTAQLQIIFD